MDILRYYSIYIDSVIILDYWQDKKQIFLLNTDKIRRNSFTFWFHISLYVRLSIELYHSKLEMILLDAWIEPEMNKIFLIKLHY